MSNKTDFQVRVLKKYGVIPVFEGEPEYSNVKTSEPGETFKQWCSRVIGKKTTEVSLFSLYQPKGNERIGRLGQDGEYLKKIVKAESRKSFLKGSRKLENLERNELFLELNSAQSRLITRDEIYETLADSVSGRSVAIDEFFKRFSDKNSGANGWAEVLEALADEYAKLAEIIKSPVNNISNESV